MVGVFRYTVGKGMLLGSAFADKGKVLFLGFWYLIVFRVYGVLRKFHR